MRCFQCKKLSYKPLCAQCQKLYLITTPSKREVGNLEVVSFFDYFVIEEFIKSKYDASGYKIYRFLAQNYIQPFLQSYLQAKKEQYFLIGVDESSKRDYLAIAQLLHYGAKNIPNLKALYNVLKAKHKVEYAGKSLAFRLANPREFVYKGPSHIKVILIDDLVTTGLTLQEAYKVLQKSNVVVEFALTLANAKKQIDY